MPSNRRLEVKLPPKLYDEVRVIAQKRGFNSSNSFVRTAIANELRAGESSLDQAEVAISASIDRLTRETRNLHTAQQAAFAMLDCLTRLFLTCVPEPPAEVLEQSKRRAKLRYEKFLRSVAQSVSTGASREIGQDSTHE